MQFEQAKFLKSAPDLFHSPFDDGHEVAFVGRSNAGKSSALNTITSQRHLARTSKTPGRTQLINFFAVEAGKRLVDLPGYGYAKVSDRTKQSIEHLLQEYLGARQCLRGLILLMDIRRTPDASDQGLIELAQDRLIPVHILLTKCDKLNRGPANQVLLQIRKLLESYGPMVSAQTFSSLQNTGLEEARLKIASWLE